ncbi:hypothetical protein HD806DRAFT_550047 [Xylariaceae sp. AK1471]|nr:hypothetical protein HD806DRAFT_550047 [Xylariaceae sp. AK1471]
MKTVDGGVELVLGDSSKSDNPMHLEMTGKMTESESLKAYHTNEIQLRDATGKNIKQRMKELDKTLTSGIHSAGRFVYSGAGQLDFFKPSIHQQWVCDCHGRLEGDPGICDNARGDIRRVDHAVAYSSDDEPGGGLVELMVELLVMVYAWLGGADDYHLGRYFLRERRDQVEPQKLDHQPVVVSIIGALAGGTDAREHRHVLAGGKRARAATSDNVKRGVDLDDLVAAGGRIHGALQGVEAGIQDVMLQLYERVLGPFYERDDRVVDGVIERLYRNGVWWQDFPSRREVGNQHFYAIEPPSRRLRRNNIQGRQDRVSKAARNGATLSGLRDKGCSRIFINSTTLRDSLRATYKYHFASVLAWLKREQ